MVYRLRLILAFVATILAAAAAGFGMSPAGADVVTIGNNTICAQGCFGAAVNSSGDVYAADYYGHQVIEFGPGGNEVTAWGTPGTGPGKFSVLYDIVVGPNGNVYTADWNNGVEEFGPDGSYITSFGSNANSLAVTPAGNIYSVYGQTVSEYTSSGVPVTSWTDSAATEIVGITYSPATGDVYVVDAGNYTVDVFTASGTFVTSWGTYGKNPGQFDCMEGIAADAAGNIFVSDPESCSQGGRMNLQMFTATGGYLGIYLTPSQPFHFTYSGGYLYVGDSMSVLRIDPSAPIPSISASTTSPETSQTVTFDASKSLQPFGSITDYRWDLDGSGNFATDTGSSPTASAAFTQTGTTVVSVRITGSSGETATTQLSVITGSSTASVTGPRGIALSGQPLTFDASKSTLSNSTITDYKWDLTDSGVFSTDTGTTSTATTTFATPGTYQVGVQVTRSGGVVNSVYTSVTVYPAPPAGNVGVSINNGDYATDSPNVELDLVWPAGANAVLISNDGGFNSAGSTRQVTLADQISWKLAQTGIDRLSKTVYVRFLNAGINTQNFTDDIILDETVPTISSATLASVGATSSSGAQFVAHKKTVAKHHYLVHIVAAEAHSGVSALETSLKPAGGTITTLTTARKRGALQLNRTVALTTATAPRYVRVRSAAGKWSRWLPIAVH